MESDDEQTIKTKWLGHWDRYERKLQGLMQSSRRRHKPPGWGRQSPATNPSRSSLRPPFKLGAQLAVASHERQRDALQAYAQDKLSERTMALALSGLGTDVAESTAAAAVRRLGRGMEALLQEAVGMEDGAASSVAWPGDTLRTPNYTPGSTLSRSNGYSSGSLKWRHPYRQYACSGVPSCTCLACCARGTQRHTLVDASRETEWHVHSTAYTQAASQRDADLLLESAVKDCERALGSLNDTRPGRAAANTRPAWRTAPEAAVAQARPYSTRWLARKVAADIAAADESEEDAEERASARASAARANPPSSSWRISLLAQAPARVGKVTSHDNSEWVGATGPRPGSSGRSPAHRLHSAGASPASGARSMSSFSRRIAHTTVIELDTDEEIERDARARRTAPATSKAATASQRRTKTTTTTTGSSSARRRPTQAAGMHVSLSDSDLEEQTPHLTAKNVTAGRGMVARAASAKLQRAALLTSSSSEGEQQRRVVRARGRVLAVHKGGDGRGGEDSDSAMSDRSQETIPYHTPQKRK